MRQMSRPHALVVDDQPEVLLAASSAIADMGYDVTEAASVAEALLLLKAIPFDLLNSDIRFPGQVDGIQLARTAREMFPSLPIVLTTVEDEYRSQVRAEFTILAKPFGFDDLQLVIQLESRDAG